MGYQMELCVLNASIFFQKLWWNQNPFATKGSRSKIGRDWYRDRECAGTLFTAFFESTKALEGDLTPTIHHVYQWYVKLKICMTFQTSDCPLLKFLKRRGFQAIDNKFEITPLHKLALFSNPKFKSLNAFTEDEKITIKTLLLTTYHPLFLLSMSVQTALVRRIIPMLPQVKFALSAI